LGAILAASLFYTPVPLVLLVGVAASVYFISRPYKLLLVMVFLIPFNFVFKIGPIPVAAELLKVFAWIPFLIYLSARKQPLKTSKYNWCFAVLGGLLVLSVFRSNDLPFTIKESVRLASNLGLCYLVLNLVDTREKVFQIFRVLAFSTFLVACYGFYQFAIRDYGALFWIVNARIDTSLAPGRETFWLWRDRITSVLTSELELGHYFNMCLPIAIVLWLTEGRKRIGSRWLWMTLAMLAGLVLTFTFGAWLALVATIGLFVLLFDKKQRWKMVLAGVLILLLAASLVSFGPLRAIVAEKTLGTGIGSLAWDIVFRLDAWLFALQIWWSHPLLGVGVGNFQILQFEHDIIHSEWAPTGGSPHQTYLYLLVQFGIVGFSSVLMVMLSSIRANLRLRKNSMLGLIAMALAFALTTNMFGWFSDDATFFGPHSSYLVWLVVGLSEAIRNLAVPKCGSTV
jgi:O-antigen ligase